MKKSSLRVALFVAVFGLVGCGGGAGSSDVSIEDNIRQKPADNNNNGIDESGASNIGDGTGDTGNAGIGTGGDNGSSGSGDKDKPDGGGDTDGGNGGNAGGGTEAQVLVRHPSLG